MGKIAVIGDVMLDRYTYGNINRVNPENSAAHLVKIDNNKEQYKLGGAANVAANIASLLGEVMLIAPIGKDINGSLFTDHATKAGVNLEPLYTDAPTIVKQRVIADNQYLLRLDAEEKIFLGDEHKQQILRVLTRETPEYIVISDYAKGTISADWVNAIKQYALENNIKILVDTKPKNSSMFAGVHLIKPNFTEFRTMAGNEELKNEDELVEEEGRKMIEKYNANIIVTRSGKGATLIPREGDIVHRRTHAKEIVDVTGAGDTFLAAVATALSQGKSLLEAMDYGNRASGIVVGRMGTSIVTAAEMEE